VEVTPSTAYKWVSAGLAAISQEGAGRRQGNKIRGYKISKGKFVAIEPEEIKAIQVESTHTLDIDKFVPIDEIDRRYFDRSCPKERPARKRSPSFVTP
jgi:non-homologous end joining protein Ku